MTIAHLECSPTPLRVNLITDALPAKKNHTIIIFTMPSFPADTNKNSPTFVIVPGAWQTPWHYHLLTSSLQNLGYRATCLSNPSNHKEGPWPETWRDDVANVASAIRSEADAGNEVVLIMHSYGGAPGSEACKDLLVGDVLTGGGVKKIVYISAVAFPEGGGITEELLSSLNLVLHVNISLYLSHKLLPRADVTQTDGSNTHANPSPVIYPDVPSPLRSQALSAMVPQSQGALTFTSSFAPWKHIPAHYILCSDDLCIPLPAQKTIASQEGGKWSTTTLETGHSPFLICPAIVADSIVAFTFGEENG
jgi:pimeloyl-ACP methyl ester carboxylesterase